MTVKDFGDEACAAPEEEAKAYKVGFSDGYKAGRDSIIKIKVEYSEPCYKCHGVGIRWYGSTATWRGGIGGQCMTNGVCDSCWGSGKKDAPWPSHREFEAMKRKQL